MSYRRRDFRPDKLPERMPRRNPADLYGLYVPTMKQVHNHMYMIWHNETTSWQGRVFTDSHTVRQRRYNQQVIRDALRGED